MYFGSDPIELCCQVSSGPIPPGKIKFCKGLTYNLNLGRLNLRTSEVRRYGFKKGSSVFGYILVLGQIRLNLTIKLVVVESPQAK